MERHQMIGTKGKGLNRIPIRFALMTAVLTTICAVVQFQLWVGVGIGDASLKLVVTVLAAAVLVPTTITYLAAGKLAGYINALQRSTDAILAGDLDGPVDVDCPCEVGGLADSFREMVGRLNSRIVRMNVLAYSDSVTGLPNRGVVTHMLGHITAGRHAAAMLFIDLDGFKNVNDMLSHEAGDELLRQVSRRIIQDGLGRTPEELDTCTTPFGELCERPPEDIVFARFAGDEFVALLPGVTDDEALGATAGTIRRALEKPFVVGGTTLTVSASIGIARTPFDSTDPAELLNFADLAMYAAKDAGRGRYVFFEPALRESMIERNELEADLRKALASDKLTLCYQPKLDSRTRECVGVEALLRWHHPKRGEVPPSIFIPIAEATGLMPALGASVLRMVAKQSRKWLDAGIRRNVAVNVSPKQFEDPAFVPKILKVLDEYGIDHGMIELEITESAIMPDFDSARIRLARLRKAGVQIAVDDFGIGFSNLSKLARLPFDALKIDRSLVGEIGRNPKNDAIVRAIVEMAHALGYRTVAEGIETERQHAFLRRIGCDRVQGYYFGGPMTVDELQSWERLRTVERRSLVDNKGSSVQAPWGRAELLAAG